MDKPISSLMEKHITTVSLNDTVDKVEEVMDTHKLSCVPLVDSTGKCFGIISAADIVHFHQMRKNKNAEHAWEMCTHRIIEISPDISIKEAAGLMIRNKIHHLVITENKSIIGIVSSMDLIRECLLKQNA